MRIVIVFLALLSGCVAIGTQVKEGQVEKLEKGKTTIDQTKTALGSPNTVTLNPDGSRTLMYLYVHSQARPESFIPVVGAFVGGADSRSNMVVLRFDARGVLIDYTASESTFGSGTGLAAGTVIPKTDQPREAP